MYLTKLFFTKLVPKENKQANKETMTLGKLEQNNFSIYKHTISNLGFNATITAMSINFVL